MFHQLHDQGIKPGSIELKPGAHSIISSIVALGSRSPSLPKLSMFLKFGLSGLSAYQVMPDRD